MKVLVVFNPVSGLKALRTIPETIKQFLEEQSIEYYWMDTTSEPVQKLLEQDFDNSFDRIIVIGGDGTIRGVADFVIEKDLDVPIGIVPQGSGNVLAAALGLLIFPLKKSLAFALEGKPQSFDVMRVNGRYTALIAAGQGYDTVFVKGASRTLKNRIGILAYGYSFVRTIMHCKTHEYEITVDGVPYHASGVQAEIFNVLPFSNIVLFTDVSSQDGLLNLVVFSPRSPWKYMKGFASFLRSNREWKPHVSRFKGKVITVKQEKGNAIHFDGEIVEAKELIAEVLSDRIQIIWH